MEEQIPNNSSVRKNGRAGLIIAVVVILFVLWMIYTSIQTQVIDPSSSSMPNMDRNVTEISPTEMPENMPGMNH